MRSTRLVGLPSLLLRPAVRCRSTQVASRATAPLPSGAAPTTVLRRFGLQRIRLASRVTEIISRADGKLEVMGGANSWGGDAHTTSKYPTGYTVTGHLQYKHQVSDNETNDSRLLAGNVQAM